MKQIRYIKCINIYIFIVKVKFKKKMYVYLNGYKLMK